MKQRRGPKKRTNAIRSAGGKTLRNADHEAALALRCRQAGLPVTHDNLKEVTHPAYSSWIGVRFIKITGNDKPTWVPLWEAVTHTRKVVSMYNAAIAAPKRHGASPMILVPTDAMQTTEDTPTSHDIRTTDEIDEGRIRAYDKLMRSLSVLPKQTIRDYISGAVDDQIVDMKTIIQGAAAVHKGLRG